MYNDDAAFEEDDDDMDVEVDYDEFVESIALLRASFSKPYIAFSKVERFILTRLLVGKKRTKIKKSSSNASKEVPKIFKSEKAL